LGGAALGLGGGAVSQVSGGLSSLTNSEVGKFATRVTTETVGNTLIDVGCQGINVLTGEQEKIDLTRTAMRAGTTLTSVAVREGIRMGQNTS
jgi:hypothetical protein